MSRQTQPRQNYHEESEAAVNRQINLELYASYVYQSMVSTIFLLSHNIIIKSDCYYIYNANGGPQLNNT